MQYLNPKQVFDYVVIGSGFGGSVAAMRLIEKGYSVLILERGKRFRDQDFPRTNWNIFKYLWAPSLRCFGILELSLFQNVLALHGSGVGGGSLGYANVLMAPDERFFQNPAWNHLADWKTLLQPHYETARRMLGVTQNPKYWVADEMLQRVARSFDAEGTLRPTEVGVLFGEGAEESGQGQEVPDPYFDGEGPDRRTCTHCGECMIGCRHNAKNTLVKNYLYFAEKWGAMISPESEVTDIRPLVDPQPDDARYEISCCQPTAFVFKPEKRVRARNVVVAAGTVGTLKLLLRCRDITGSLPAISPRLGEQVHTNSENLLGVSSRSQETDFSQGIAITSLFQADPVTVVEPVRYPAGSSLIRFLSGPFLDPGGSTINRVVTSGLHLLRHPIDALRAYVLPGWAQRTTILLVMQTEDECLTMRIRRSLLTLFRRGLVSTAKGGEPLFNQRNIGYAVTQCFADQIDGIPATSINESLLNIPVTAHLIGGCPLGRDDQEGVVGLDFRVHNYPGLYVIDGSTVPANPGINPSLTITALAEYALSLIPKRG